MNWRSQTFVQVFTIGVHRHLFRCSQLPFANIRRDNHIGVTTVVDICLRTVHIPLFADVVVFERRLDNPRLDGFTSAEPPPLLG